MRARLSGGHFRMINEKLYTCTYVILMIYDISTTFCCNLCYVVLFSSVLFLVPAIWNLNRSLRFSVVSSM